MDRRLSGRRELCTSIECSSSDFNNDNDLNSDDILQVLVLRIMSWSWSRS